MRAIFGLIVLSVAGLLAQSIPFPGPAIKTGLPPAATPVWSPGTNTYGTAQTGSVTCSTGSSYICYSRDGTTTPVTNGSGGCTAGSLYSSSFSITTTETDKAVCNASGYTESALASQTVTISGGSPVNLIATSVCGPAVGLGVDCTITSTGTGHGLFALLYVNSAAAGNITSVCNGTGTNGCTGTDTFTQVAGVATKCEGVTLDIWYAPVVAPARTTLNVQAAMGTTWSGVVYEASGTNATSPLDQSGPFTCASSCNTNVSGHPVTITSASELIIGQITVSLSVTGMYAGNSFTNDSTQNTDGWAHLVTTSTGTYTPQWASTGTGAQCGNTASFKP